MAMEMNILGGGKKEGLKTGQEDMMAQNWKSQCEQVRYGHKKTFIAVSGLIIINDKSFARASITFLTFMPGHLNRARYFN